MAPEHAVCDTQAVASRLRRAGTIFVGSLSAQACGDYATGSNHVLPTMGAAAARGGLSAADFVRLSTVQQITARGLRAIAPAAITLADGRRVVVTCRVDRHAAAARKNRQELKDLMSYEYERVLTPSSGLRLHLNENTAGCSPRVIDALRTLTREHAAFYPDYQATVDACARHLRVEPDRVQLTNGLDEGILACSISAVRGSAGLAEAVVVVPAFDMYAACADAAGARVIEVAHDADWAFPLDAALRAIGSQTRLVFLTTPNNPTGRTIPREAIVKVANTARNALVFVDEAYIDFGGESLLGLDDSLLPPNIIVGRTFAKAYGLAAVRAGALVANPRTLAPIRRTIPPFSVNVFATVALQAAIEDTAYYTWYLEQVRSSKNLLYAALDRINVRYWKSDANFVFANFGGDAKRVVEGLAARQIHVRDKSRDPACPGCIRITTGVVEHTQACITALEEVLCGAAS